MQARLHRNRVGILATVKTVKVAAGYWDGDFNFKPTLVTIKFKQK